MSAVVAAFAISSLVVMYVKWINDNFPNVSEIRSILFHNTDLKLMLTITFKHQSKEQDFLVQYRSGQ